MRRISFSVKGMTPLVVFTLLFGLFIAFLSGYFSQYDEQLIKEEKATEFLLVKHASDLVTLALESSEWSMENVLPGQLEKLIELEPIHSVTVLDTDNEVLAFKKEEFVEKNKPQDLKTHEINVYSSDLASEAGAGAGRKKIGTLIISIRSAAPKLASNMLKDVVFLSFILALIVSAIFVIVLRVLNSKFKEIIT
jgi:hypothetical protein